jgi:phosphate transport system substrate-binding protein
VQPSPATIASRDYPLARPLFVYASRRSLKRPAVREFMRYYLTNATRLAESVDIVPAPVPSVNVALRRVDRES